ncbi:MAG TPA: DinB family protein [Bryobacteraceae bacterium]|jgi:uncharacterized damage-inducible protein DinB|nr:DinB family protein [Bryobacteraceae bacterium]
MNPEQATFLLNEIYLPQIRNEHKTTRRVIEAIPCDNCGWKPDPTSKSALELAWHIASSECFFLNGIALGKYERTGDGSMPSSIKTPADLLKWYDENHSKATAELAQVQGDNLATPIDFFGMFSFPAVAYAGFMCSHSIHHRGQLSSYLRPMGGKVPSIYGPSADEGLPARASA